MTANTTSLAGQAQQLFTVPPPLPAVRLDMQHAVQQVWAHYQELHPRARLDRKRASCIAARIADGYTPQQLRQAIEGCHSDPWYQGENDRGQAYCELSLILRDAAHVDKFIGLAERPRQPSSLSGRDVARASGGQGYLETFAAIAKASQ